ncbi:MAG: DNA polymerase III subunit alpha, partial [Planctomycetota bacterium]
MPRPTKNSATAARDFVHLHVHSDYSLLDGACKHEKLIALAKSYDMHSVACTDHGNLFGALEFYNKAHKAGIKPVIGCELYTVMGDAEDSHRKKGRSQGDYNHLLLLCKDIEGWQNLSKLTSLGFLEGFYYKPRVSRALLKQYSKGLIATSACLKGEVCQHLIHDRKDKAKQALIELRDIFGEENFYLEVQKNGLDVQDKANQGIIELSQELSLPLVATCDVHWLRPEDRKAQDCLVCINTGKLLSDPNRLKLDADLHFRSQSEVWEAFGKPYESAIDATVDIASRCNVEFDTSKTYMPVYKPDPDEKGHVATPDELFEQLCEEGIQRRYGLDPKISIHKNPATPPEVLERLAIEMGVIQSMGFTSYFLITWDFINWAKEQDIPVGPGRGSAAGSIVAYSLGITDLCPLKYNLLFERFLNKERVSMPDIDIDFCQERRQEVIEYVKRKYGKDAVSQIITFGTMAAKSVIRDVCRVIGVPLHEADRLAKMIPLDLQVKRKKLKDALAEVDELREAVEQNPTYQEVWEIAEKLEGFVRNASTHAAGVVIGDGPLIERVPLYRDSRSPDDMVTQFTMGLLEDSCGLLKMDFLGLKTLTVIK